MSKAPEQEIPSECLDAIRDIIVQGYEAIGYRVATEKLTELIRDILRSISNPQVLPPASMDMISDAIREWSGLVSSFVGSVRTFVVNMRKPIEICYQHGVDIEEVMKYIDPMIDMILGRPSIAKEKTSVE